jgi:hypothetical protein
MRNRVVVGAAVIVALLAWQIGYGVSLGDALLYLGYELCFVLAPGWLAYLALAERPGGALRQVAIGWALGYVLEILAFMLTAAIEVRPLFFAYPVVVCAAAALVLRRPPSPAISAAAERGIDARLAWGIGAVCVLAVSYIALSYFPGTPLPGGRSVDYFIDYPRWIAMAADAKHHWPIMEPSVSGEPLPYHYFVNVHLAAASQVTGLGLPLIYFRLFILPLTIVTVLLLVVAGQSLVRSPAAGLIAAALAFLVGELRLDPSHTFLAHAPFYGLFFTFLFRSPSFFLGLVIFIPLVILIGERIAAAETDRKQIRGWLLIGLFMVGATGAKISILPLIVVALLGYALYRWIVSRRVPPSVFVSGALALLAWLVVYVLQYRGHSSGLRFDPFSVFNEMPAVLVIKSDLAGHLADFPGRDAALGAGGIVFGSLGLLLAPLIGIVWVLRKHGLRVGPHRAWLFALLGAGIVMGFGFREPATQSALYFLFYGIVAGYLLSAEGLVELWNRRPSLSGKALRFGVLGLGFCLVAVALIGAPTWFDPFSGPRAIAYTYMFRYGGLLVALVLLYAAARAWAGSRWGAGALVSAAILAVGALATPIDNLEPVISNPTAASQNLTKKMTPGLYGALTWIRDETPTDTVIAVNNQWIDPGNKAPLAFIYSAFGERRVFLEGWAYSQAARDVGYANVAAGLNPFANRLRLNLAAFTRADLRALGTMVRDYGVRYLLIDELNGYPADRRGLRRVGEVVYRAPDATVLRLGAGGP